MTFFHLKYTRSLWDLALEWTVTTKKNTQKKKRKKPREDLKIGERVYLLAERTKKKSTPGNFYKQSVQNISYFNKETVYTIRKKQLIDGIRYYWVRSPINDLPKRFLRAELFWLKSNFIYKKKKKMKIKKKIKILKKSRSQKNQDLKTKLRSQKKKSWSQKKKNQDLKKKSSSQKIQD